MMTHLQQLRLLQLSSPSLPVGGFTYSQGLEWAIEAGWISNLDQFLQWQINQIEQSLLNQDLPLLQRLYNASLNNDVDGFDYWSQYLVACRETLELRCEENQRGEAMRYILNGLKLFPSDTWKTLINRSQIAGLAWVGSHWGIPIEPLMLSLSWSNLEITVMAGAKLLPFGQKAIQSLLSELSEFIASRLPGVMIIDDDNVGGSLPIVAIASSRHEMQGTRLFRS